MVQGTVEKYGTNYVVIRTASGGIATVPEKALSLATRQKLRPGLQAQATLSFDELIALNKKTTRKK